MTRHRAIRRPFRLLTPFGWRTVLLAVAAIGITITMGILP